MIRVIGGIYKGKKLRRVADRGVRPIPHKLKESLFSVIHEEIKDTLCLDGFSGTGSVGIEALSRGARAVFFVDDSYAAVKVIKANIAKCEAEDKARVIHREFNRAVIQLSKEGARFDWIFLDPPYKLLEERNPLKVIKKREILNEGGKIILRHHFKTQFDAKYYEAGRKITLGDDTITFYEEKKQKSK